MQPVSRGTIGPGAPAHARRQAGLSRNQRTHQQVHTDAIMRRFLVN